jgi:hypothetical protein
MVAIRQANVAQRWSSAVSLGLVDNHTAALNTRSETLKARN